MNAIRKSEIVAVGTVYHSETTTVNGHEFLRLKIEPVKFFKGNMASQRTLTVDVRTAGKETPQIEVSKEYLFFLRPSDSTGSTGRPWQLVDLTRPVEIAAQQRDIFSSCLRDSVRLASQTASDAELKQFLIRMLKSGVSFFQSDASRFALTVTDWSDVEIEELVAILAGKSSRELHGINERENVTTLVVQYGAVKRVTTFARLELKKGNSDPIYYGLYKRAGPDVDATLWGLLRDPDIEVSIQALRVAGLLRRADILDSFEKELGRDPDTRILAALGAARTLVGRD